VNSVLTRQFEALKRKAATAPGAKARGATPPGGPPLDAKPAPASADVKVGGELDRLQGELVAATEQVNVWQAGASECRAEIQRLEEDSRVLAGRLATGEFAGGSEAGDLVARRGSCEQKLEGERATLTALVSKLETARAGRVLIASEMNAVRLRSEIAIAAAREVAALGKVEAAAAVLEAAVAQAAAAYAATENTTRALSVATGNVSGGGGHEDLFHVLIERHMVFWLPPQLRARLLSVLGGRL
jgi:hypothetical protein